MKKFICAAAFIAVGFCSVVSFGGCKAGEAYVEYTLSEDGTYYIVSGVSGDKQGLTRYEIPAEYSAEEGGAALPVKEIGDEAFYRCNELNSVTLPDTVERIGERAFAYTGITAVTIPDSVTTIAYGAFGSCDRLTEVTIPEGVTRMEPLAFAYCTSLERAVVKANITVLEGKVFYNSVVAYGGSVYTNTSLKEVRLPATLEKIEVMQDGKYLVSALDGNMIEDIYFDGSEEQWDKVYFYQKVLKEGSEDEYEEKKLEKDKFLPKSTKVHFKEL